MSPSFRGRTLAVFATLWSGLFKGSLATFTDRPARGALATWKVSGLRERLGRGGLRAGCPMSKDVDVNATRSRADRSFRPCGTDGRGPLGMRDGKSSSCRARPHAPVVYGALPLSEESNEPSGSR